MQHSPTVTPRTPHGAIFYRCALQVNPHGYRGQFQGLPHGGDERAYARELFAVAADLGIAALAITDHNNAGRRAPYREASERNSVVMFPGFEISSKEGIHILCIYPPSTSEQQLERYLGELGIQNADSYPELSDRSFAEILRIVKARNGITIAAHVTQQSGLFKALSGQACIDAWKSPDLLAIQIPGPVNDLPQNVRQIVENRNQQYRRPRAVGDNLAIAAINAKDVSAPDDLRKPAATTWIKMSEIGIEGLRQAFLDPDSRIRLNPVHLDGAHPQLIDISWQGGLLHSVTVNLNPNLNVLVGGRGVGKSTVIESLRYALDIPPIGENAATVHRDIVNNVLRPGTKISLRMLSAPPSPQEYRIERIVPNPPVVRKGNSEIANLRPRDLLPRAEVYGQHEISELTENREKLTQLLNRFSKIDTTFAQRKADIRKDLRANRQALAENRTEMTNVDERLAALPGLEEELKRFRSAGLEDRLRERSLLVREERVLALATERLEPLKEHLASLRQSLPIDNEFLSPRNIEALPGGDILANAARIIDRLNVAAEAAANRLEGALKQADNELANLRVLWDVHKQRILDGYHTTLRDLGKSAIDGEAFIRLREEIERLRPLRERKSLLKNIANEHTERRSNLVDEWEDIKAEEFRLLTQAAKSIDRRLHGRIRVRVKSAGNLDPLIDLLRTDVRGRLSETINCLKSARNFSQVKFVLHCRRGPSALQDNYGIPGTQGTRLTQSGDGVLMKIEELELPATTDIQLNVGHAESPSWHSLNELSAGQRATAILLLLLLDSDAPLIVDQPEDDLDNRFIVGSIVRRMRDGKQQRQFIFSTHNANIPVLGDAELVLGLNLRDGAAEIPQEHRGSIDTPSVRELLEEILEGGKDAFEIRRRKYGF